MSELLAGAILVALGYVFYTRERREGAGNNALGFDPAPGSEDVDPTSGAHIPAPGTHSATSGLGLARADRLQHTLPVTRPAPSGTIAPKVAPNYVPVNLSL